ncbi:MAG: putative molybdopterin biosynthesis protein [Hyphomicrobiaceae bacterium]|jgi:putative molybdopterin biosynthesis protein
MTAPKPGKFLARVSPDEARRRLLEDVGPLPCESISIDAACGRITAAAIYAIHDAPHYRASAMDGIAVRAADTFEATPEQPVTLGLPPASGPGCAEIDTGGVLPDWADAVVRIEDVRREPDGFSLRCAVAPGHDVRRAGEDIDKGSRLLPRGARITPWDLGALIAAGIVNINVVARPRLAILPTGSEVTEPIADPAPGQVLEYNGRMIEAAAVAVGIQVTRLAIVADDQSKLERAVADAAANYDAVAVIAGSSVGRRDLTVDVLAKLGDVLAHGVDMMPGKPVSIARIGNTPIVGIPGYPVSAIVAAEQLLAPLLAKLAGVLETGPERVQARIGRKIPSRLGVEEFRRVCLCRHESGFVVAPLPRGAGAVSTAARAHGWLRIGPTSEGVDADAEVTIDLIRSSAEALTTVVIAGAPDRDSAALEDDLRANGHVLRMVWLGNSQDDAVEALVAGEAHAAVFGVDDPALMRVAQRLPEIERRDLNENSVMVVAPFAATLPNFDLILGRRQ